MNLKVFFSLSHALITAVGMQNGTGILKTIQKTICRFSSFKLDLSYDPAVLFYSRKMKTHDHITTRAWLFIYKLIHHAEVLTFHQTHPSLFACSFSIQYTSIEYLLCGWHSFRYWGWNRKLCFNFCFVPHFVGIPLHRRRSVSNKKYITK